MEEFNENWVVIGLLSAIVLTPSISLRTPIILPYVIPYVTPSKEFRLWFK